MPKTNLSADQAITRELEGLGTPVVLRYDVARLAWGLYRAGSYAGQALDIRRATLDMRAFARIESSLQNHGVLKPTSGLPGTVYSLFGGNLNDRNAVVCSIDPFCYVSHLSAMEFHGLTDRLPEQLYVSAPSGTRWTSFANERMQRDLGSDFSEYQSAGLPLLRRVAITKLNQQPVHRHTSVHLGAYRSIKNSPLRVATVGRTFLDMLRDPGLCGGIHHVLQVFQQHAVSHLRLIFDELDQHGTAIDKVRVGFILEELCKRRDPRIDAWVKFAARGGSRKLDPAADYSSHFSERWCLSINVTLPSEEEP